ncbi:hypothetical protein BLA50215_05003 [Burkholderia lata]|nr:hypothetical protein BLA50215_05003 [Burkholderia lata]
MIEQQRDRQRDAQRIFEVRAHVQRHQRIHAHLEEAEIAIQRPRVVAEHLGHRAIDAVRQQALSLARRCIAQCRHRRRAWRASGYPHAVEEGLGSARLVGALEQRQVDIDDRDLGHGGESIQHVERAIRRQRPDADTPQQRFRLGERHAAFRPGAPVHAQGRQALAAAMMRERVEEAVRGAVVRLLTRTPRGRDRRKQDEEIEREVLALLVEQPRTGDLRLQDRVQFLALDLHDRLVADDAGRVHDAPQRHVVAPERGEEIGDRRGVGDIEALAAQRYVPLTQLGDRPLALVARGSLPADQDQRACAARRQPPGGVQPERAEPAGDQVGRVRGDRQRGGFGLHERAQARDMARAVPQRHLFFAALAEHLLKQRLRLVLRRGRVEIDRGAEPFRMLDHRPACQARQCSLCEPGYVRRFACFHRVARDHRDPGPGRRRPLALAADQRVHEMQQRRGHARRADGFVQRP